MNPEEFDKRLSESFKNESLPPDKQLWQNISSRLDESGKKPFWLWFVPVILLIAAAGGWLLSNSIADKSTIAARTETTVTPNPKEVATDAAKANASAENHTIETTIMDQSKNNTGNSVDQPQSAEVTTTKVAPTNNTVSNTGSTHAVQSNSNNTRSTFNSSNSSSQSSQHNRPANLLVSYMQPDPAYFKSTEDLYSTFLKMNNLIPPPKSNLELPKEELIAYEPPFKNAKAYRSPYTKNPVNYDNKWWWSVGLGPQISFNKAIIPNDSEQWVHKELWANRSKMTSNGSGFHSQFLLGRKLGKHFSVETGVQYSRHTEDIRFSLSSYDIENRDSNNKIDLYLKIKLYISLNPGDTTFYDATRGFALAIKNRYNIFTIPVKFNFEYDVSDKTKFVAGIGAGLTAITTKRATHLNLINDMETIERKANQYMTSLNAQFGFYTNFNDIGQLGIYSGFQMYTKPWELSNKQYGIKMSDLQLGLSFRRPLNW